MTAHSTAHSIDDGTPEVQAELQRYYAAVHGMQSGVAMTMNYDAGETQPKHLRVGVNSAHVSASALTTLLVEKGLATSLEVATILADFMEAERDDYQRRIRAHLGPEGPEVTLR